MRKSHILAGAVALAAGSVALADVYNGAGGPLPDRGALGVGPPTTVFTSTVNVAPGTVVSVNSATLTQMTPSWAGDLVVSLTAPNGDNVHLFSRVGATDATGFGSSGDLNGTYTFVETGGATMPTIGNVPSATYNRSTNLPAAPPAPDNDPFAVFAGDPAGGNWTL